MAGAAGLGLNSGAHAGGICSGVSGQNNPEDIEAFKKQCNPLGEIEKEKVDKAIREALDTIKPGSGKGAL